MTPVVREVAAAPREALAVDRKGGPRLERLHGEQGSPHQLPTARRRPHYLK